MRAREVRHFCRSLLVVGALVGTAGPVLAQSSSPNEAQPSQAQVGFAAPNLQGLAPELPQFLDEQRVPELHNAWRLRADQTNAAVANETAMSAARAAMQRQKEAVRQAPDVRQRAEALSHLFAPAAETTAQQDPAAAPATITTARTAPASAKEAAPAQRPPVSEASAAPASAESPKAPTATAAVKDETPLDPPYAVGGPPHDEDAVAAAPSGPVQENTSGVQNGVTETGALGSASGAEPETQRAVTQQPPLPERAPAVAVAQPPTNPVVTTARAAAPSPRKPKPNPAYVFPDQLRSFGWNSQPE